MEEQIHVFTNHDEVKEIFIQLVDSLSVIGLYDKTIQYNIQINLDELKIIVTEKKKKIEIHSETDYFNLKESILFNKQLSYINFSNVILFKDKIENAYQILSLNKESHLLIEGMGKLTIFNANDDNNKADNKYILEVRNLKKYFPLQKNVFGKARAYLRAVDNVTFGVEKGKTIGVVGESGCGKTTLGRTILKLYDITGGKVFFEGNDITDYKKNEMRKLRTSMQLIFQDPYSSLPPRMTIGSIIEEAVKVHKIVPKDQIKSHVQAIMKQCGLQPQYYDRYPHEFSGGQRQRICIARALAVNPKLVICDEPVSALDVSIQAQIINLLKELQTKLDLTYVFISHDLSVVKYITNDIIVMYLGNMMEMADTEEIFKNPMHPYTQALFSAVPIPNPDAKMNRIVLEGDIPSPVNPPRGCKFHTRCAKCMDVCKVVEPEFMEISTGHHVACHLYNSSIMKNLTEYQNIYETIRLEEERKNTEENIKDPLKILFLNVSQFLVQTCSNKDEIEFIVKLDGNKICVSVKNVEEDKDYVIENEDDLDKMVHDFLDKNYLSTNKVSPIQSEEQIYEIYDQAKNDNEYVYHIYRSTEDNEIVEIANHDDNIDDLDDESIDNTHESNKNGHVKRKKNKKVLIPVKKKK